MQNAVLREEELSLAIVEESHLTSTLKIREKY